MWKMLFVLPCRLRRTILANLPSDHIGFNRYWQNP
jgi:hypothetical protein